MIKDLSFFRDLAEFKSGPEAFVIGGEVTVGIATGSLLVFCSRLI